MLFAGKEICLDRKYPVQGEIYKKSLSYIEIPLIILKVSIRSPLILLSRKALNPKFCNLSI